MFFPDIPAKMNVFVWTSERRSTHTNAQKKRKSVWDDRPIINSPKCERWKLVFHLTQKRKMCVRRCVLVITSSTKPLLFSYLSVEHIGWLDGPKSSAKTRQQCLRRSYLKYFPQMGGGYIFPFWQKPIWRNVCVRLLKMTSTTYSVYIFWKSL